MAVDVHRAASLFERYRLACYTAEAEGLLGDDAVDLIYIASNRASHAEHGMRAIRERQVFV
jgi:predicted dehydrogenase